MHNRQILVPDKAKSSEEAQCTKEVHKLPSGILTPPEAIKMATEDTSLVLARGHRIKKGDKRRWRRPFDQKGYAFLKEMEMIQ